MGVYNRIQDFIISWRFAVLMLSVLFFFTVLLIVVIALPTDSGPFASFAEDFKVWCFQYDPATGTMEWSYVVMFLLQPILISIVILAVWWKQLVQVFHFNKRILIPYVGSGLMVVIFTAVVFSWIFPWAGGSGIGCLCWLWTHMPVNPGASNAGIPAPYAFGEETIQSPVHFPGPRK